MFELIGESPIRFILALVIGLATAWWIWARLDRGAAAAPASEPAARAAPPPPAPKPAPAPVAPAAAAAVAAPAAAAATAAPVAANTSSDGPRIAAAVGADDDLTKINGIGPKLCALCNGMGVRRFDQIAAWGVDEVAEVDGYLGSFKGRIDRDQWIEQAKLLAAGNESEWASRFGYKGKKG